MNPESDSVLLVIPCRFESRRLPRFLHALATELEPVPHVDILVVDDGSGPEEQEKMRTLVADAGRRWSFVRPLLALPDNLGKGGCVYTAWGAHSAQEWLAFVDADGSCGAPDVRRLIEKTRALPPEVTAVFASRIAMLGRTVRRHFHRHLLGRAFALIVSRLLRIDVHDSQCGLKLVRRRVFDAIKDGLRHTGFAFDVELLAALVDTGHQVVEEPIDWHQEPGGKVRLLRDSFRMLRDVLDISRQRRRSKLHH